jgi:hypothetical protein
LKWCSQTHTVEDVKAKIEAVVNLQELGVLFNTYPEYQNSLLTEFQNKKASLRNNLITSNIHNGSTGNK